MWSSHSNAQDTCICMTGNAYTDIVICACMNTLYPFPMIRRQSRLSSQLVHKTLLPLLSHAHIHTLLWCPAGLMLRELLDYTSGFNGQTQADSQSAPGWNGVLIIICVREAFCWITTANNVMTPMMSVLHPHFSPCRCYLITDEWAVCV